MVILSWLQISHCCPFCEPSATTSKSARDPLTAERSASLLIWATVTTPGSIAATQVSRVCSRFSVSQARAAAPGGPPKKQTDVVRPVCTFKASKMSEPLTLSLSGSPSRRAIQMMGMPSGGQKSLFRRLSRKSEFDRLVIRKLRFGVEIRNIDPRMAAERILFTAPSRSVRSIGAPKTQNTSRFRSLKARDVLSKRQVLRHFGQNTSSDLELRVATWNC